MFDADIGCWVQGHVNNVNYYRYAESARVNWIHHFAGRANLEDRARWAELMTPRSTGLIMRTLKAEFKFVSLPMILLSSDITPRLSVESMTLSGLL